MFLIRAARLSRNACRVGFADDLKRWMDAVARVSTQYLLINHLTYPQQAHPAGRRLLPMLSSTLNVDRHRIPSALTAAPAAVVAFPGDTLTPLKIPASP
jgi:hypothetical protein